MNKFFAGIDLGTSGCRIVIIGSDKIVHVSYSLRYPKDVKQSTILWWETVTHLLSKLPQDVKNNLQALAIDGTSGSILLTDSQGESNSSVLMYDDLRAASEAELIEQVMPQENGGQGASGSLARLLWLLKHEPNKRYTHAVHQADYILGKLANNYHISDENNCLKLGYDVINQRWPEDKLSELGVDCSMLPEVLPAGTVVAQIDEIQAGILGLPKSLKLVTGTTDSIAAFIATGANKVGDAVTSLGSTLVLKLISDKPIFSPKHGVYSHRLNNQWLVGGASNSGAKVLQHYFSQSKIDALSTQLSPDKPIGLDYYPLIGVGERFPIADVTKLGRLSPRPKQDSKFFQGILEGIASIEAQGYQKLVELGASPLTSVRSVGGGSKNTAWAQIRSSHLNEHQLGSKVNMITPKQTEAAFGSALLALKGYNSEY